jgi:hypothetical protein
MEFYGVTQAVSGERRRRNLSEPLRGHGDRPILWLVLLLSLLLRRLNMGF